MDHAPPPTARGAATRERIVTATADRILAGGIGATRLDDIRAATRTSKSQLFHYFPGGKTELVRAVAEIQGERVLDAQRPELDALDSWASWERWRTRLLAHYDAQPHWGCPIGSLTAEAAGQDPALARHVADYMTHWRGLLEAGVQRMKAAGLLRLDADAERLAAGVLAAIQGGLLLTATEQALWPLEAALDAALASLRAAAA
jgi:AcrR family transcriptional regulator